MENTITTGIEYRALAKYAQALEDLMTDNLSMYVITHVQEQITSLSNHVLNTIDDKDMWDEVNNALGVYITEVNSGDDGAGPAVRYLTRMHWALLTMAFRS